MSKGKKILYGESQEKNIVQIETDHSQNLVHIFKRENGELKDRYEPLEYVAFINKKDEHKTKEKLIPLLGGNYYNRMLKTSDLNEWFNLKKSKVDGNFPYLQSQYMLQTGKTCFKGMDFNDPLVLFFDLEVLTTEGYNFPNASRSSDEIMIIAMRTNRDEEILLYQGDKGAVFKEGNITHHVCENETLLLEQFIYEFRRIDPDIVANHNIFNFDLPYLETRCYSKDVDFALGRNGSTPNTFETQIKFGDRMRGYTNYQIYGRTVIDTQYLAEYADVVMRKLPTYALKGIVQFLGKADEDRTYIDGKDISDVWRGKHSKFKREDLIKYAIEDVREAEVLYKEFGQSIFMLAKMIPMNFQEVFRYGTGNQVEYVFNREYLRNNYSLPKADPYRKIGGGYADVLQFGMVKGSIVYADVKSLYPSLAKLLNINPYKDELGIYQLILEALTSMRYEIKAKIKEYTEQGYSEKVAQQKATDGSVKIFLNTMSYGFLAFGHSGFNDFDEAERITVNGQKTVKSMIDQMNKDGAIPIKVDTDGVALKLPDEWADKPNEYCQRLTDNLPEGIIIENDGEYDAIISFDRKSYALLEKSGKVTTKGNTISGRSTQKFYNDMIRHTIEYLFNKTDKHPQELYKELEERIRESDFEPEEIRQRSSLKKSLPEYQMQRDAGDCNTLTQYELAINAPTPYEKGDIIHYYVKRYPFELTTYRNKPTVRKKKCKVYEAAELIERYDYDIEPEYYYDRLEKAVKKFMILGKEEFENLFDIKTKKSDITKIEKLTGNKYGNDEESKN